MMARYILHIPRPNGPTADELELINQQATVLDQSRRALLIDTDEAKAGKLAEQLPDWSVQPETIYPIPDVKKRVSGDDYL